METSKWLVTGCAGFIGSNLVEQLLKLNQIVVGIDNLSFGYKSNLENHNNFTFIEGDIRDYKFCLNITKEIKYVLHHAAIASVPLSIKNPIESHEVNVSGFLNILHASKENKVKKFIYASSSAIYGDSAEQPKKEENIGNQLSPYAVNKYCNELYANNYYKIYGLPTIGLRYFNIFGKKQDPNGAYAAVIPKWIREIINNKQIEIYGDGETSRDFCHIDNIIQINILSALSNNPKIFGEIFNCAYGESFTLNELFLYLKGLLSTSYIYPKYKEFRSGDIKHSSANIDKATSLLNYQPKTNLLNGLKSTIDWYMVHPQGFEPRLQHS